MTLYKCNNLNYYYENDKGIKIEFFTKEESTYLYFWDIYYKDPFIGFKGVIENKINIATKTEYYNTKRYISQAHCWRLS